jgi:cell division protein FtsZ
MSIKLQLPKLTDLRPRISVIGVGGAGGNAINNMIAAGLSGVEFVAANTDSQALAVSSAEHRIQLGMNLTEGLGAGSKPEIGEAAAEEATEDIRVQLAGTHMLFIAAGMGGGTGTGAAAVIARIARELGVLTVAVVTKPFMFEGSRRMRIAEAGVVELKKHVDTLIVIPNQNLFRIANAKTTFAEAFVLADQVLYSGIACIVDLIVKEGLINLDLADVKTVLQGMGTAMMGTGEAAGEDRAIAAAEEAITNPLIDDVTLKGAKGLLLSIIGGPTLTLYEVDQAASRVRQEVDPEANIIVGATFDESLGDRVRVSIVASGMARVGAEAAKPRAATPPVMPPPLPSAAQHGHTGDQHHAARRQPAHEPMPRGQATYQDAPANHGYAPPLGSLSAELERGQSAPAWQGPGDVTIEERSPFAPQPRVSQKSHSATSSESAYRDEPVGFTPEAPAEVRRSQRRMPNIDDFPDVGQRAYRANSAQGYADQAPLDDAVDFRPLTEAKPKKNSLLQRLTGARSSWRKEA